MSNNLFQEVLTDAAGVKSQLLGPDAYPYYTQIRTPSELGMSGTGSLSALGKDIQGLQEYVALLVSGKSKASSTGKPLGNKFFMQTMAKCDNGESRYVYFNFIPNGNIPLLSNGLGVNFSDFEGLIPGTISNLNAFNPMTIMQSFLSGGSPSCQELTMETIDNQNEKSTETHYVSTIDIQNMDPCWFSNKTNPITGAKCRETFGGMQKKEAESIGSGSRKVMKISIGLVGIAVLAYYCHSLATKKKK